MEKPALRLIVMIGDSTVASGPPDSNSYGWGQKIGKFFTSEVKFKNAAEGGRSSKSFIREGVWEKAREKADYFFIQFGHNDCPGKGERTTDPQTDYKDYLRRYVDDSRAIQAIPVFVTPVARRTFDAHGKITSTLTPYVVAMKQVAAEKRVPLIDLNEKSTVLFEKLGDSASADLNCEAKDRTHFSEKGALKIAELVVEGIRDAVPELKPFLRQMGSKS